MIDPRQVPAELDRLVAALEDPASHDRVTRSRPATGSTRRGAVLAMIGLDRLDLTFTERSATMRSHPGQLSFPGGSLDPGETPVQAALREACEEVALGQEETTVLGVLPAAHVAASSFDVTTVVGIWDGLAPITPVDPREVAAIHRFTIAELCDPANRVTASLGSGYRGPAFVFGELFLWGFTAHLVDCLLDLGGWTRPWTRGTVVPVPPRFIRDGKRTE